MEEYYGGKLYYATDDDIAKLLNGFNLDEVCKFHKEKGGVVCDQKRRTDADCERCGWNPRVARRRLKKIKEHRGQIIE